MSKIIVTGAHGYIAGKLIRRLLADGHTVVGLTRKNEKIINEVGYSEIAVADYTNEVLLTRAVSGARVVFHLASRAHQRTNINESIELYHSANVIPAVKMAHVCAQLGVGRFVMVSSIGVLGNYTNGIPFSDESIPAPVEPYSVSKAIAEQRVTDILRVSSCSYCILRPPLVYGPGCPGNFANLVKLVLNLPIIPFGGVSEPRTFIYIEHLLDALIIAATHPEASKRTFVVSDETNTSVSEIIKLAAMIFGRQRWLVFAVPKIVLHTLSIILGRHTDLKKILTGLCIDSTGFKLATGWRAKLQTVDAIAETLKAWPREDFPRIY
ncbi:MAG: hypothetical protein RL017_814 [Pseudomonadota bacterium]